MGVGQVPQRIGETVTLLAQSSNALTRNAGTIVGIVVALPEELRTLTRNKLKQGEYCRLGDHWVAFSGAGIENAAKSAQLLLDNGAQRLLSWGCAAGLDNELKPGDLVLANQVLTEQDQFDTAQPWCTDIQQALGNTVPIKIGKLFTSIELVSCSRDKQQIQRRSQAIALDMETAAIAAVARQAGVPFLAFRCIADPVSMDLPKAVLAGLNDKGQIDLAKLLRHLLLHPWEVIGLIRLGLHFHAAQKTLKIVARHLGMLDVSPIPIAN